LSTQAIKKISISGSERYHRSRTESWTAFTRRLDGHNTSGPGVFRTLVRNALPATAYFRLPPEQVVEIALHIDP
jgi:hypothetical protein